LQFHLQFSSTIHVSRFKGRCKFRLRSETAWTEIASTYERTISLPGQPRGVELEYSVYATNKAGDGPISNTVMVVL
jgi:hypothetical protein